MPRNTLIILDLLVVAALVALVAEEVQVTVRLPARHVSQTLRLIPTHRDTINTNLPTDSPRHVVRRARPEALAHLRNHPLANPVLLILRVELVTLLIAAVAPNRTNINHTVTELDKRASLLRDARLRQQHKHEVDELLYLLLA